MRLPLSKRFLAGSRMLPVIIIGGAIVVYVGFLLGSNYLAQITLQDTLLKQFAQEAERRSSSLSYFFADRRDDMVNLALSREISVYFESKALGMSLEYGLNLSLIPIEERISDLIARRKIGSDPIYSRIVLIDCDGKKLIDVSRLPPIAIPRSAWTRYRAPVHKNGAIIASDEGGLMASIAYIFKGRYSGQIVAWLRPETINRHFLKTIFSQPHHSNIIMIEDRHSVPLYAGYPSYLIHLPEMSSFRIGGVPFEVETQNGKESVKKTAILSQIRDTHFFLTIIADTNEILGGLSPRNLFMRMGILALAIMGGAVYILVLSFRSLLLRMQLNESIEKERIIQEKHRQLEAEVTERKRAEEALRESEELFRSLVNGMLDTVIIVDWSGNILFANSAAEKLVGLADGETVFGLNMVSFLHPDSIQDAIKDLALVKEGKGGFPGEYKIVTRKGREKWVSSLGTDIVFKGQSADLVTLVNITERKQMEETIRQAKEIAEAATRAKSDFLANMSHEVRTPLNAIIGFTQLVLNKHYGDLNPTQEEYLSDVLNSSRHLLSLINDILDLSKVEAGKMELQLGICNLRELLSRSMVMIREKALKHKILLTAQLDGIPEQIIADERKIKQVVYNLLSNAVKFTPDAGSVTLSGKLENIKDDAAGGSQVTISVKDTGIGLCRQDLQRIFNPFVQVDSSTSRRYSGTGLGLSLSKQFIEMHGGMIWAESPGENQGSVFLFSLPT
jgi:PAS domain S-box-containing protein